MGDCFLGLSTLLPWVDQMNVVLTTVEYRLAPEHPGPYPVEDYYAALVWLWTHAEELGGDRERIVVVGIGAGGGLAAGTALLARDRHEPPLLGQLLLCPTLDDRDRTLSAMLKLWLTPGLL